MSKEILRNDDEILRIIKCEKIISRKPPNLKESNRDRKCKFNVASTDSSLIFEVFFAQNIKLPDDFSIGLMFGDFQLIRYNGFHGETIAGFHRYEHHAKVHSHTLTLDDIMNGRGPNPSKIEYMTGKYYDFESAQRFFLRECSIINYEEYFDFTKYDQISFDTL
ncbi:MAG: hypothetical protein FWD99_08205 [Oscillospiraceae bacterium]|nr:hypothetical protein [Oscillospiraceae bacterium]